MVGQNNKTHLNKNILFFAVSEIIGLILSIIFVNLSILIFNGIFSVITTLIIKKYNEFSDYAWILIAGFSIIMLLVYFGWLNTSGIPYLAGGSDDLRFEELADLYLSRGWLNFTENHGYSTNTRFYIFVVMILKKISQFLGGYHTILPRILNGYLLIWSYAILNVLMNKYWGLSKEVIRKINIILCLNVYVYYLSSFVFRDTLCLFFILLYILLPKRIICCSKTSDRILSFVLFCFLLFVGYYLRGQLLLIGLTSLLICCVFHYSKSSLKAVVSLSILLVVGLIIDNRFGVLGLIETNSVYTEFQTQSVGLSHSIIGLPLFPFGLVARIIYALIYPFPAFSYLFFGGNSFLLDFVFLLAYLFEFRQFINIPFILKISNNKNNFEIASFFILFLILFCVGTFTFRHFIFLAPFLTIMQENGKSQSNKRSLYFLIMFFMYCLMQFLYIIV